METLSDRLNYLLSTRRLSQTDLARMISVKPQVIQYLCRSKARYSRFTFEIAQVLSVSPEWLATGIGEQHEDNPLQVFMNNKMLIPVYDYMHLSALKENHFKATDNNHGYIAANASAQHCFGLIMPDNSMQPIFNAGSVLVIQLHEKDTDEDIDKHEDKKYALVFLAKERTFIIRQLTQINQEQLVQPINTALYKEVTLTKNDIVIGKVILCVNAYT